MFSCFRCYKQHSYTCAQPLLCPTYFLPNISQYAFEMHLAFVALLSVCWVFQTLSYRTTTIVVSVQSAISSIFSQISSRRLIAVQHWIHSGSRSGRIQSVWLECQRLVNASSENSNEKFSLKTFQQKANRFGVTKLDELIAMICFNLHRGFIKLRQVHSSPSSESSPAVHLVNFTTRIFRIAFAISQIQILSILDDSC